MSPDKIGTETMSSMIPDSVVMTVIECPHLLRGADRICLGSMMTDAHTAASAEVQSTPESQALMQDRFLFKVWLTEIERAEKAVIETSRLAAGSIFQVLSVSAEQSGLQ